MKTYTFGYNRHHHEVWFHLTWRLDQDTFHLYWSQPTLGL